MNLKIQILSIVFSFLFGLAFSLFLNLNFKIIYNKSKVIKYLGSFLVILISVLIYFILLQRICNSYFHPYHLLVIIFGFYFKSLIFKIK